MSSSNSWQVSGTAWAIGCAGFETFTDAEDIADVAVAALTENGHTGRFHEVTGPRLLTFAEYAQATAGTTSPAT